MSSGLTAAKCPSCKIILLRPVYQSSSSTGRASSAASTSLYYCPACGNQYSQRKGCIIPAILLTSAACNSGSSQVGNWGGSKSANCSPVLHRRAGLLVSPLASDATSLALGHSGLKALNRLSRPKNLPVGNRGLSMKDPTPSISPELKCKKRVRHRRTGSLGISCVNELVPLKTNGDSRSPQNDGDKVGRLSKIKSLLSGSPSGDENLCLSDASPQRGTFVLPPVIYKRAGHRRRSSLSDMPTKIAQKPILSTYESLMESHREAVSSGNYEVLQEMYVNTFSSWEEISRAFKDQDLQCNLRKSSSEPEFGIDMKFVHHAYCVLMQMPKRFQRAVMKSIIGGLLKESKNKGHSEKAAKCEYSRAQLILMENPQFDNPSAHAVFGQLLKNLSQLPSDTHKWVAEWLRAEYNPEWMKNLVSRVQRFISMRQFPSELPQNYKPSPWIPCALKVLSLLREASLSGKPPLLSYKDFYIPSLDHTDLMADFFSWQNHDIVSHHCSLKSSYCQYPFVLSLSAKKHILQHDSRHRMLMVAMKSLSEKKLQNKMPKAENVFLNLQIRRSHLIEDSISELIRKRDDLKKKIKVTFSGEPGVDMGGLTKEWFLLLLRNIFMPEYGLFTCHEDSEFFWFSSGLAGEDRYSEYHLVGLVSIQPGHAAELMGLAVYNSIILDLRFPPCCFKKLLETTSSDGGAEPIRGGDLLYLSNEHTAEPSLGKAVGIPSFSLNDLEAVMPTIARSLKYLQDYEGDVEDLCYTFQVSHQVYGSIVSTELLPDGRNVAVTDKNKNEFVDLYVDHLLNKSVSQRFAAFHCGFHSICNSNALRLLCPEEIEALICGFPEFDVEALKNATTYEGYVRNDLTIKAFWEVVTDMDREGQKKLMLFVTGSYRIPIGGISSIGFKISRLPFPITTSKNILPMAHTCFNQLLLPPYEDKRLLTEKLVIAISNSEGFGLV